MKGAPAAASPSRTEYDGAEAATTGAPAADPAAEWALLDEAAAVWDSTWRRVFPATGSERLDFLHGQTTADLRGLAPGCGAAALVLTAQGRPVAMLAVYEDGERAWLSTTATQAAPARAALSRFLVADDCEFGPVLDAPCVTLAGPRAGEVLAAAGAGAAGAMQPWALADAEVGGQPVRLLSRGDLRVPCFDVLVADGSGRPGDPAAVRGRLLDCGAGAVGVRALETVRVESGTARHGVDVDDGRLVVEARLEWAIHFAKGCYVGQEVVERAVSRGRLNHELSLLRVPEGAAPGWRAEGGSDRDVLTSVVHSPRLGTVALGYLPRALTVEGTVVRFEGQAGEATVLRWPRERVLAGRATGAPPDGAGGR